jgi:XTP/dITP diphosphohydrolase
MLSRALVLGTRNEGKITEFHKLLSGFDIEIMSLKDFGPLPPVIEDGETFEDNAYKKAHATAKATGMPALADDSGLTVASLGGAPGVRSARYAGENATDEENNRKLLREMEGISNREAAFECVLVIAVPRGPALVYEGRCEGLIGTELRGDRGFGYDPLFYYAPLGKTFAELSLHEKNDISHRGKAMLELKKEFSQVLGWLEQRMSEEPV